MTDVFFVHGQFVSEAEAKIPAEERGHQFGDGVYEVVRVYGGRPFLLSWHLERLVRSCRAVGIENPYTDDQWTALIGEGIRRCGAEQATVYWQVTRGAAPRVHTFPTADSAVTLVVREMKPSAKPAQAKLLSLPDERFANVWIKTINLLPNVIAKESAKQAGCAEALLWRNGIATECASSNVWFVKDGALWTHPANRYILGGVTRRFVKSLADNLQIPVYEQAVSLRDLDSVEGIFITGTTTEIQQIHEIVVDQTVAGELTSLPDTPPQTILRPLEQSQTMWRQTKANELVELLRDAYAAAVERFAEGEMILL